MASVGRHAAYRSFEPRPPRIPSSTGSTSITHPSPPPPIEHAGRRGVVAAVRVLPVVPCATHTCAAEPEGAAKSPGRDWAAAGPGLGLPPGGESASSLSRDNLGRQHFYGSFAMSEVTRILSQIESGDPSAAEQLLPLRRVAEASRNQAAPGESERDGVALTALVHDACFRLVSTDCFRDMAAGK